MIICLLIFLKINKYLRKKKLWSLTLIIIILKNKKLKSYELAQKKFKLFNKLFFKKINENKNK